jgi:hypothetical protein
MGWDHTFIHPLGVDHALFHMNPLPLYLDDATFDKEVKLWVGVIREETLKMGQIHYFDSCVPSLLLHRHQLLPPVQEKGIEPCPTQMRSEEDDEETLPQGPILIPLSLILYDAQISGKQFWKSFPMIFLSRN